MPTSVDTAPFGPVGTGNCGPVGDGVTPGKRAEVTGRAYGCGPRGQGWRLDWSSLLSRLRPLCRNRGRRDGRPEDVADRVKDHREYALGDTLRDDQGHRLTDEDQRPVLLPEPLARVLQLADCLLDGLHLGGGERLPLAHLFQPGHDLVEARSQVG